MKPCPEMSNFNRSMENGTWETYNFNETEYDTYIECVKTELRERFPLPIIAVQIALTILVVIGNTLNIIVFSRKNMRSSSSNMLCMALEISNLTLSLIFTKDIVRYFNEDKFLHWWYQVIHLIYNNIFGISLFVANWTAVTIGVWRFLAVAFPMKANHWCSRRRAKMTIALLWTIAAIRRFPFIYGKRIVERTIKVWKASNEIETIVIYLYMPVYTNYTLTHDKYLWNISETLKYTLYVMPLLCLAVLTVLLIFFLWKSKMERSHLNVSVSEGKDNDAEKHITIALTTIIFLFFLSHVFFIANLILSEDMLETLDTWKVNMVYKSLIPLLIVNVLTTGIYCYMSKRFLDNLKSLFPCFSKIENQGKLGSGISKCSQDTNQTHV